MFWENKRFLTVTLTLLLYGLMAVFYNSPALSEPRLNRELFTWFFWVAATGLYGAGFIAFRLRSEPSDLRLPKDLDRDFIGVLVGALALMVLALFIPPFHSTDLYGYINRGWQQVSYGVNPYIVTVNDIPGWENDPMLTNHWVNNPSPYGFLYMQIARTLTQWGQGIKPLTIFIFKSTNLLLYLACGLGIWFLTPRQSSPQPSVHDRHSSQQNQSKQKNPATFIQPFIQSLIQASGIIGSEFKHWPDVSRLQRLYLFLWNPLILVHGCINGHNDIWMGALLLLAFGLAMQAEKLSEKLQKSGANVMLPAMLFLIFFLILVLPVATAATLTKYAAVVILPLIIIYILKQKKSGLLKSGILLVSLSFSVLVIWTCGQTYLQDWQAFKLGAIQKNAFVSHGSLHAMIYHAVQAITKSVTAFSFLFFPLFFPDSPLGLHTEAFLLGVRTLLKNLLLVFYAMFCVSLGIKRLFSKSSSGYSAAQLRQDSVWLVAVLIGLISLKFYPWYLSMILPVVFLEQNKGVFWFFILLTCFQLASITFIGQAHMLNFLVMTLAPILLWWQLNILLGPQSPPKST
ncbi:MAG: hypothetical protein AAGI66_06720 [Cyanobacteria bacterium P01_H01_bin.74]